MSLSWIHLNVDHWSVSEPDHPSLPRRFVHGAGHALLADGLEVLARGLDINDVARRASRSRRLLYVTFQRAGKGRERRSPRRALIDQVAAEVCDASRSTTTVELGLQMMQIIAPEADTSNPAAFEEALRRYANDQFHEVLDDDIHRLQSLVWALGQRDEAVRGHFQEMYASWTAVTAAGIVAILESTGFALRPPFTPALLATSLTALVEGLATRARVDPAAVPLDLFGELVVAIVRGIVTN